MATNYLLNVEKRLEDAAIELLAAYADLTGVTGFVRVQRYEDASLDAAYPIAAVRCMAVAEHGHHTGCYQCGLELVALSYKLDDKAKTIVREVLGALRGWVQQDDVIAQLNATASATADATKLTVIDVLLEDAAYDSEALEPRNYNEYVMPATIVCRPS